MGREKAPRNGSVTLHCWPCWDEAVEEAGPSGGRISGSSIQCWGIYPGNMAFLLDFQVLFNLFKIVSQVWHIIILSQIHLQLGCPSKSGQELLHDVQQEVEESLKELPGCSVPPPLG